MIDGGESQNRAAFSGSAFGARPMAPLRPRLFASATAASLEAFFALEPSRFFEVHPYFPARRCWIIKRRSSTGDEWRDSHLGNVGTSAVFSMISKRRPENARWCAHWGYHTSPRGLSIQHTARGAELGVIAQGQGLSQSLDSRDLRRVRHRWRNDQRGTINKPITQQGQAPPPRGGGR
jgi:hypothetical protein